MTRHAFGWLALVGAVLVFGAGTASAADGGHMVYGGLTGSQMAEILREQGYKAELDKDSDGDPMIRSAASGAKFKVLFYGCSKAEERVCKSVQFLAYWDKEDYTADKANTFNSNNRNGRLWIDGESLVLTLEAEVDGVTPAYFRRVLVRWEATLGSLYRFFETGRKG